MMSISTKGAALNYLLTSFSPPLILLQVLSNLLRLKCKLRPTTKFNKKPTPQSLFQTLK
jgi:hypothetical protein